MTVSDLPTSPVVALLRVKATQESEVYQGDSSSCVCVYRVQKNVRAIREGILMRGTRRLTQDGFLPEPTFEPRNLR